MKKSLKSSVLSGASLTVTGRLIRALQGIVVLGILSRYVSPEEFGIMSMTAFIGGFAQIFVDFGTRVALVQRQEITNLDENSVFWWSACLGFIISLITVLATPLLANWMGSEELEVPLYWLSTIFVIGGLQSVSLSVLERKLAFGWIAASEVISALSASLVAVLMVILGYRIEALIGQMVTGPFVAAVLVFIGAKWRPKFEFSRDAIKSFLSYGGYVTAAQIVQISATRADRPIVGTRLSSVDLGYSSIAEQVVLSPLRITVQMVRKVMFPVMATIQNDNIRIRRGYLYMQHGLMVVMAPIAFGLWAISSPLVEILLGEGWSMVAVLMGWLAIRTLFTTFSDLNSLVFSAKGHARFQFQWSIFSALVTISALLISVQYGIEAVVISRLVSTVVLTPINAIFALRLIDQPLKEVCLILLRPLISALTMGAIISWIVAQFAATTNNLTQLAICIPFGVLIYVACEIIVDRKRFFDIMLQIKSRGRMRD
jgi:O-antigen/teichoic acid export membrane protein